MIIKVAMLVVFFGVMIYVGIRCRRHSTDVNSFVLGGRSVGPWLTAFAYGTSYFSAVIFIGYAGQFGWKFGVASTWIGIGNALIGSLLAWVILGRRTRLITQKLGTATMPDYFGKRFASPSLKIGASIIIFVFLIPYTASLYNGLSRLFSMAFGIDYIWCIVGMSVLTCIYVVVGGYMATAVNDFIQGIIMLIGIVAVIASVLNGQGGFTAALEQLANVKGDSTVPGAYASFFGPNAFDLLSVVILTSLGTWGLPQMIGKFYAIKDEKSIRKGTIISTVFALIVAGGCYFLGGFGRLFPVDVAKEGFDAIIPAMLKDLPAVLIGVVVILVLSASMSTLSSLVLTSSSTLTLDLIKGNVVKNMKENTQMTTMRVLIIFFVVISAFIAILQYKANTVFIAQLMGISWGALAGAFLAPYLFSLYWKRTTKAATWVCFGFGVTVMVLNMVAKSFFPVWLQSPINCGAFTMLAGFVIVPIVSLLTPKPKKELLDDTFSCYDKEVTTSIKEHLE
ncbi:MAG: sodium:solute symporter [Ruminococcaceae bacterium]|nr:sodium:solute symporter [Oscillospiraceae bacterium]